MGMLLIISRLKIYYLLGKLEIFGIVDVDALDRVNYCHVWIKAYTLVLNSPQLLAEYVESTCLNEYWLNLLGLGDFLEVVIQRLALVPCESLYFNL